jgi:hypothetical protein
LGIITPRDVDGDLRDQISRIEADIDQLAKTLDRCRKAMLLAKVTFAAGGIWFLGYFLGAIRFDPTLMVGAIAATIGGVVILGSNSTTSQQTEAAMKAAEIERDELIDTINPRAVGMGGWEPSRPTIH